MIKSMEHNDISSNLICDICEGTGSLLIFEKTSTNKTKRKYKDCFCFKGCLFEICSSSIKMHNIKNND